MKQIFRSLEDLKVVSYPLGILEHRVELKFTNSHHCVDVTTINNIVDYEKVVKEQLQADIFNEIFGELKLIMFELAEMASLSDRVSRIQIEELLNKAELIYKGE